MSPRQISRRAFCAASLAVFCPLTFADAPAKTVSFVDDFDALWRTLSEQYCYFQDKTTDWQKVRALYRPKAIAAGSIEAFTEVVRRALAELYDAHTHLSNPPDGSPRWPLYDLLVERAQGQIRIVAMEEGSAAADGGLKLGDSILAIDGVPIEQIVQDLSPQCLTKPDPAANSYALNVAVAGRRGHGREFTVLHSSGIGGARTISLPVKKWPDEPDLEFHPLPSSFGYILIRSFASMDTITAFDQALASLRNAPGLVIDVRDNGGGDTAVARPIMGRFIHERRPYALMRRRAGGGLSAPWTEYVDPRGPFTYTRPVVVLTSPWSGSMAEGFPMGMRDLKRGRIVGTKMMGLGAAVYDLRLKRSGIQFQYSAEPVYDTQGVPRSRLRPDVEVPYGGDALAAGIDELRRMTRA